jgi:sugar phosphate isomerase/epimerase
MFDSEFVLTGFGDEIDADLDAQLDTLDAAGLSALDLRSVEETNVLDLSERQVRETQATLDRRGVEVSSIGSPIGKVGIEEEFDAHLDRYRTAVERAKQFDTEYIRLFSYYIPDGDDPAEYREEVLRRMRAKTEIAEEEGVTNLLENERDLYGDTPLRCRDLLEAVDSPHLRGIFDPANYVLVDAEPFPDALLDTVEHVEYLHIKDATWDGEIRPAGEGNGGIPETLAALDRRGFSGYVSLEPHLAEAGRAGGYSGPEAFRVAADALQSVLDGLGADYR